MSRVPPHSLLLCLAVLAVPATAQAHPRWHGPLAHIASAIPDDPGRGSTPMGWEQVQWNFVGPFGVGAQQAWDNAAAAGHPGGRGTIVAVLDTGVAYANRGRFRRSPDLSSSTFVRGYDFVDHDPYPDDPQGHGTHVASTIAEATDNGYGLTGLAWGARIMPVRVLDTAGEGDAGTIAKGVRYAATHGAQVINLSLEFSSGVTAGDIPSLIKAIAFAHRRGVVVVAASGNEAQATIAYPARATYAISVGATTEHGCLADYSNQGRGLNLVAPGGGADAALDGDPNCRPAAAAGHDVSQITYRGSHRKFGIDSEEGTSMAVPHVSATAALIIASGVIGKQPTPTAVLHRLEATARDLGATGYDEDYGWGLVDAAAATTPGGPTTPVKAAATAR
jgi:serine protease